MKCSIKDCPGEYEAKLVTHTVPHNGRMVVIDHVPARVCGVCGEVLLSQETIRHIERLPADLPKPKQTAPVYEYAASA